MGHLRGFKIIYKGRVSLLILGPTLTSWMGEEGKKKRSPGGDHQQPVVVLEYSKVFWQIR